MSFTLLSNFSYSCSIDINIIIEMTTLREYRTITITSRRYQQSYYFERDRCGRLYAGKIGSSGGDPPMTITFLRVYANIIKIILVNALFE